MKMISLAKLNEIELICYKTAWNFLFLFEEHAGPNFEWNREFRINIKTNVFDYIKCNMGKRNQKEYLDYADEILDHICKDITI